MTSENPQDDRSNGSRDNVIDEMDAVIAKFKTHLDQVCARRERVRAARQIELHELREKRKNLGTAIHDLMFKNMQSNESPSQLYFTAVKNMRRPDPPEHGEEPAKPISPYVISLEAQLCRSIHHMVLWGKQVEKLQADSKGLAIWVKSILTHIECGVQTMQVKQAYSKLDNEIRDMKTELQTIVTKQRQAMERFDVEQSDGLDIVGICRHQEHLPVDPKLFFYETSTLSLNNKSQEDRLAFAIRRLFRSSDKPLSFDF